MVHRTMTQSSLSSEAPASADADAAAAPAPAPLAFDGRKPVTLKKRSRCGPRFAETAGETAAECAAICCCCPCFLVDLLVVLVVKLPAGLIRRALQRRRSKRRKKAGILKPRPDHAVDDDGLNKHRGAAALPAWAAPFVGSRTTEEAACPKWSPSAELLELERVMRANFNGAGFWRSPSQREY